MITILSGEAVAQLTPSDVFMSSYGNSSINNGTGVAANRANAFDILTNGIVDRGDLDRVNTFNLDDTGVTLDFVGLQYATPSLFDFIQIELGRQFGDGGDWEAMPNVYILKDLTMLGDTVEPNMSPNWVQLPTASIVETTGHAFTPINVAGPGGTIRFDLTGISAADRTGWGWAVGGVDGDQDAGGIFNFTDFTEAFAEGLDNQAAPPVPAPLEMTPVNVVSNVYHTVGRNGDALFDDRGQAFASVTNGVIDHASADDGFDTWQGDADGVITDFAGLIYRSPNRFDTLTVELAMQFGDGGDWEETPRVFILMNPVDTNTSAPESDPANWREITGLVESTGHVFTPLNPGFGEAGGTVSFDLTGVHPALRSGYGWAIGGVDGNQNADGINNFISVAELTATGQLVPEPSTMGLLALGLAFVGLAGRRGVRK